MSKYNPSNNRSSFKLSNPIDMTHKLFYKTMMATVGKVDIKSNLPGDEELNDDFKHRSAVYVSKLILQVVMAFLIAYPATRKFGDRFIVNLISSIISGMLAYGMVNRTNRKDKNGREIPEPQNNSSMSSKAVKAILFGGFLGALYSFCMHTVPAIYSSTGLPGSKIIGLVSKAITLSGMIIAILITSYGMSQAKFAAKQFTEPTKKLIDMFNKVRNQPQVRAILDDIGINSISDFADTSKRDRFISKIQSFANNIEGVQELINQIMSLANGNGLMGQIMNFASSAGIMSSQDQNSAGHSRGHSM